MKLSKYFRSLVFGYNAPEGSNNAAGIVLWFRIKPDYHIHVMRERAFTHRLEHELAPEILAIDQQLGIAGRIAFTVANPACFGKHSEKVHGFKGQTVAETFAHCGILLMEADDDEFNGWHRMRGLLRDAPDGSPWLVVDHSCEDLIRGLATAMSDELHPDELDTYSPALHALRYAAMSMLSPDVAVTQLEPPIGSPLYYMRQAWGETVGRLFGEAR